MKKSIKLLTALSLISILALVGCKKEEPEEKVDKPVEEVVEEVVEEPEVIPENQNLLTGVPDLTQEAIGKRPVAVMIGNTSSCLPQYGIDQADIIFEIPVEGDVTRFMALYGDYTQVPQISPIRSCRYYFPAISEGFDAFYAHWGKDITITDYYNSLNLSYFDGVINRSGLFGRDQERAAQGFALEHTSYFDGTQIVQSIQSQGMREDLNGDKLDTAFNFNGLNEQLPASDKACTTPSINFGGASAEFTYDEATKTYLKNVNGQPQIDAKTEKQLAFTNVIFLETSVTVRPEYDTGLKDVEWRGGPGTWGFYISNGTVKEIRWEREGGTEAGDLLLYDMEGNEISINRGKTYIAYNNPGNVTL